MDLRFRLRYEARLLNLLAYQTGCSTIRSDEHATLPPRLRRAIDNLRDHGRDSALAAAKSLVLSYYVLQRSELHQIKQYLQNAARRGRFQIFFISSEYESVLGDDGKNANRTVLHEEQWLGVFRQVFSESTVLPTALYNVHLVVTWTPRSDDMVAICKLRRRFLKERHKRGVRRRIRNALLALYFWPITERGLRRITHGKALAIVGNARSLGEQNHGAQIDRADIVVRCNRGPIVDVKNQGRRTDWLCTALSIQKTQAVQRGVDVILWMGRRSRPMRYAPSWMLRRRIVHFYSRRKEKRLKKRLGSYPTTGLKAIDLISRWPVKALDIYGFDFFQSTSTTDLSDVAAIDHNASAEKKYVHAICRKFDHVVLHSD